MNPQLRVGWIAPGRYYNQVLQQKYTQYLASPAIPQAVTAEIMSKGLYDRHLRQARENYRQRSEQMNYFAEQYFPDETLATSPKGGLVTWFEMPAQVNATELYHQCRELKIRIAPGELFSTSNLYKNHFRLTFASEWTPERIAALKAIGEKLKRMV
jgi:DNA-binding transcriptional MocR family regulator